MLTLARRIGKYLSPLAPTRRQKTKMIGLKSASAQATNEKAKKDTIPTGSGQVEPLLAGDQGQEEFLEPLALAGGKLIQLNPHLISTHNACA